MPDRAYQGLITYNAKDPDTAFPAIEPIRPPEGAPNVLVVLIDDTGPSGWRQHAPWTWRHQGACAAP